MSSILQLKMKLQKEHKRKIALQVFPLKPLKCDMFHLSEGRQSNAQKSNKTEEFSLKFTLSGAELFVCYCFSVANTTALLFPPGHVYSSQSVLPDGMTCSSSPRSFLFSKTCPSPANSLSFWAQEDTHIHAYKQSNTGEKSVKTDIPIPTCACRANSTSAKGEILLFLPWLAVCYIRLSTSRGNRVPKLAASHKR